MFENWQKLVSLLKNCVQFLRKSKLHDVKQNEKYPYAVNIHFWQVSSQNGQSTWNFPEIGMV